nr:DUF3375 family protein [Amycolatopsis balhimycina]
MEPAAHGATAPVADLLPEQQRRELTDISRRIEQGVKEVLTAQRQASHVITTQVRNHDPMRDREVDELLRDVMSGCHKWVPGSRRGEAIEPLRRLPVADVGHLRQRMSDLRPRCRWLPATTSKASRRCSDTPRCPSLLTTTSRSTPAPATRPPRRSARPCSPHRRAVRTGHGSRSTADA